MPSEARIIALRPSDDLATLFDRFASRYPSQDAGMNRARMLAHLFDHAGVDDPRHLTSSHAAAWITAARANNSVRQRLSLVRVFYRWAIANGHADRNPADDLTHVTKSYPTIYGKRQHQNPARFLTYEEAYGHLIDACRDGTWHGSRDQLAIRLGLLGLRVHEIRQLSWGDLLPSGRLEWIGKGNKPRTASPGPVLLELLDRWRRQYQRQLHRPLRPTDPIICGCAPGNPATPNAVRWGQRITQNGTIRSLVVKRAEMAGLGHVATHDLRRTAASILHAAKTADGGHLYDLLDIQQVLDHSDPATTMRSYLAPMNTATKDRAGHTLD